MVVVLAGAGFSCRGGVPLAKQLFDVHPDVHRTTRRNLIERLIGGWLLSASVIAVLIWIPTTTLADLAIANSLLDRTVWVDIGIGRSLATMSPKEIAALKRCKEPTIYFERSGNGVAETLYAGMTMRSEYPRMSLKQNVGTIKILLYNAGSTQPSETLQLTNGGTVLVQQTRGFRRHTFLRCNTWPLTGKRR